MANDVEHENGDSSGDRPPSSQLIYEHDKESVLSKKAKTARAVLICAGLGMAITMCVFVATFFGRSGIDLLAIFVLFLFLVCGIFTHWHIVVRVKKNHPKYFCPFILVFLCILTVELAMGGFGIYQYSIFARNTEAKHAMFATLLFFGIFLIQGAMLCTVLFYRRFRGVESRVNEELNLIPSSKGDNGEYGSRSGGDVVNAENGEDGVIWSAIDLNETAPLIGDTTIHPSEVVDESSGVPSSGCERDRNRLGVVSPSPSSHSPSIGCPAIGIYLGSWTGVGVMREGKVEIIKNEHGHSFIPSVVSFTDQSTLVGAAAAAQKSTNPRNTVYDINQLIGRNFSDPVVQSGMEHWPFKVVPCNGDTLRIDVELKEKMMRMITPGEITAMIIGKMKDRAESFLGVTVKDAVITVPSSFNHSQRQATKDACAIAGLNVLCLINEPSAVALAYGLERKSEQKRKMLFIVLGKTTLDVSLLVRDEGVFEVKSIEGDSNLGRENFVSRMVDYCLEKFMEKHGKDLSSPTYSMDRIRFDCKVALTNLFSSSSHSSITIDSLIDGIDFHTSISRHQFKKMCEDLRRSVLDCIEECASSAGLSSSSMDDVIVVAASSDLPMMTHLLSSFCRDKKSMKRSVMDRHRSIVRGAAVQAALLSGISSSSIRSLSLLDVATRSIDVETVGGSMRTLIDRNSALPAMATMIYRCNEIKKVIKVFESTMTVDINRLLGQFDLSSILTAPNGLIEVTFLLDVDGILSVSVRDTSTGDQKEVVIDEGRLTKEEMEKMADEFEKYKAEDRRVSARKSLNSYIQRVKEMTNEKMKEKISEDDKTTIVDQCNEVILWLRQNPTAQQGEFMQKKEELEKICEPILSMLEE